MMSFSKNRTDVDVNKNVTICWFQCSNLMMCKQALACLEDFQVKMMFKQHVDSMIWTCISLFEHRFWSIQQWLQTTSVEQIRRVFGNNWRIFWTVLHKNICCGYSLESPHWGDSNEYPQHMFLRRNKQNYPLIITKYPPYLFHWAL